jgi:hypothetical protein
MTQRDEKLDSFELDVLFDTVRSTALVPSDDFMARLTADAEAECEAIARAQWSPSQSTLEENRKSWSARLLDMLGGWGGASGLVTATVAGLAIGFGAPMTVSNIAGGSSNAAATVEVSETASYVFDDLIPSFYDLAVEG